MVNKHFVDKTVSGHESLFTGLFVFLLYADVQTGNDNGSPQL